MSHHYSGPDFGFPHGDARLDFTDLYAFPKPGDVGKSILVMNVHPSATVEPPGPTTAEPFATEALYEFRIDTDGDAVADIAYQVRFSSTEGGAQSATVRRLEGAQVAGMGDGGQVIIAGAPVSTGREARVTEAGDHRFFAGWRSDPFFFDVEAALHNLQFTGEDFFADKDVCSIVLELPNAALAPRRIGLWARTLDGAGGRWVQADRGALPAQAVFFVGEEREAYLAGEPADDARFVPVFAHALEHTGGYTPEEARRVAETLLPEILPYDPTRPASFPDNGRTLTDDAGDAFLAVLTNGKVTEDNLGPHSDLLDEFPYLGPPHNAWRLKVGSEPTHNKTLRSFRGAETAVRNLRVPNREKQKMRTSNIANKVVVITGASSGIGESTARLLAGNGAKVVLGARRKDRIDALVNEITAWGGSALGFQTDVTKRGEVEALVQGAIDQHGRIDVIVNNAGIMPIAPVAALKVEEWDRMIDVNLKGLLYGVAAVLPVMQRQKQGHIINMASILGFKVLAPGGIVYSATKFAVRAVTEGLRIELKADNIRCTMISPGAVATELPESSSEEATRKNLREFYKIAIPADSIARAIAYAIEQPADVEIDDVVIRPTAEEL